MGTQETYRVELRKIRFHKDILKNVVRIGLPAGLQSVMYSFLEYPHSGEHQTALATAIAAWAAISAGDGFLTDGDERVWHCGDDIAGQGFGARQYDRMKRCTRVGLACLGTIIALSALCLFSRSTF